MDEQLESLQIEFNINRELHYGEDTNYAIYSVTPLISSKDIDNIEYNQFGNITLKGYMPKLEKDKNYKAEIIPKEDKKYGLGYEVKFVFEDRMSSKEEQALFLKTFISEAMVEKLLNEYPNDSLIELIKNDKIDVTKVKGLGDKTLASIKEKVIENEIYEQAVMTLYYEFGISFNVIKRLSDKYSSPNLLLQKVRENPYILTEIDGFGFSKVDEIALKMGIKEDSPKRILSCIFYCLEEVGNDGHCYVTKRKLVKQLLNYIKLPISQLMTFVDELDNKHIQVENDTVYLKKYYNYELGIYENIKRLLDSNFEGKVENIDVVIEHIEKEQGVPFTDEQRKAIYLAVNENVLVVNGKAGTGKTFTIKGIVKVLQTIEQLKYCACALSGKASQRIFESTGLEASTMHRLLGYNPAMGGFTFDDFTNLENDIIVLDEGSMVNSYLFHSLLKAIKNGAKIIICGDISQLEPIGVGNVLVDLINSNGVPSVQLTKVHRQAQASGILSGANLVREGKAFYEKNKTFQKIGELQDLYLYNFNNKEKVYDRVLQIAKQYKGDIMEFQVLVPMKNRGQLSTSILNNDLQEIFNENPEFVDSNNKYVRGEMSILVGDKVIISGNNYDKDCFNGTLGIVELIDMKANEGKGEIIINFEGVGVVMFEKKEMNQIELAYAMSIHKSQGSEFKFVVLAFDYSSFKLLTRQLIYTGMTRAREYLFMACENSALEHAIRTNNSVKRNTFLQGMFSKQVA